ncbi:hypothetical protein B7463_g7031, partial [Scytalidium lignicola]
MTKLSLDCHEEIYYLETSDGTVTPAALYELNLNDDSGHHVPPKTLDPETGDIVGYARWILPPTHATTEDSTLAWPEAVVLAAGPDEEAEIRRIADTAIWDPNTDSDELLLPIREIKNEILTRKPYMRLDYLAVHPQNQAQYQNKRGRDDKPPQAQDQDGARQRGADSEPDADAHHEDARDESPREDDSSRSNEDEDGSFDPDVISAGTSAWMTQLHVLSHRAGVVEGIGFISGVGKYYDSAMVKVDPGDDPDFDENAEFICYDSAFPFHWCCFELLIAVFEKSGVAELDKNLLFWTMSRAKSLFASSLDKLDYGEAGPIQEQWWTEEAGKEFVVVQPTASIGKVVEVIKNKCSKLMSAFNPTLSQAYKISRVRNDPFKGLPVELLDRICSFISLGPLVALATASVIIDSYFTDQGISFWRRYIEDNMPWNFEMLRLLDSAASDPVNQTTKMESHRMNYTKILLWIDEESTPRRWMRGPFMSMANRRRIWDVCEQLEELYWKQCARRNVIRK